MKTFLIIGASTGIGLALGRTLKANGHKVIATGNQSAIDEAEQFDSVHKLNVLDESPDLSFIPESLDGLAYCPGAVTLKPFARLKSADFIDDYQLQVMGAIKIIQACLPALKKSGNGSIVLFSTVAVQTGFNFHSIVAASKGALEGLTRSLAAELAPTIRVNAIAPSITQTPLTASLLNSDEKIQANAQRHPLKKIGSPETVAQAAGFLLTDASGWMTGQVLSVDGGISAVRL
jgi:NAD(P)-dependent dehydrogenase (short-subunit alcohol dehydrogenase family)